MWKKQWSGKDSEVPDRMRVKNASDLGAREVVVEQAAEESSADERSAAAVAHGHVRVREHAHVYYSRVYSYAVIQVRAAGGFEGAGDRGGEAQGTTTREFAGETRIKMRGQVQRAMVVMVVRMTMMMYVEIEVFHCSCCCSGQENGEKRRSGGGEVSLSGIGSGWR